MADTEWKAGAKNVIGYLKELRKLTADADGAHRVAWTPTWDKAQAWFKEKMEAEGAEISVDSANSVWAKIPGETEEAVLIGSHLDCVPNGGWLDGALVVTGGMGAICRYGIHGKKPKKTIYVVSWADEEGARFGRSCIGSSAVSGALDVEEAAKLKDNDGISFVDALKRYHLDVHDFPKARDEFLAKNIKEYLELHIEQAPVLESQKKSVACVYGITGCERQYITFHGQRTHSGAPIPMRHDAFLAAAEASLAFRDIGLKHDAYCTVGKVSVAPDVVTIRHVLWQRDDARIFPRSVFVVGLEGDADFLLVVVCDDLVFAVYLLHPFGRALEVPATVERAVERAEWLRHVGSRVDVFASFAFCELRFRQIDERFFLIRLLVRAVPFQCV